MNKITNPSKQLINWLAQYFTNPQLNSASNDASFRCYFRLINNNKTYIVMDSSLEKTSLLNFINIHNILQNNKILVPKIYQKSTKLGYLLLEDLGITTLLDKIYNKHITINFYKSAIDNLINMQNIKTADINIAQYDNKLLITEMELFINWYLVSKNIILNNKQTIEINKTLNLITSNIIKHKKVFVHRDYHSRNIMLVNNKQVLIDFQDALIGSYVYDLCSLLKDAYYHMPDDDVSYLLLYFYQNAQIDVAYEVYLEDFKFISIQRQLKVLGIFSRLSMRDNKQQYLDDIPLIKSYLLNNIGDSAQLNIIKELL